MTVPPKDGFDLDRSGVMEPKVDMTYAQCAHSFISMLLRALAIEFSVARPERALPYPSSKVAAAGSRRYQDERSKLVRV